MNSKLLPLETKLDNLVPETFLNSGDPSFFVAYPIFIVYITEVSVKSNLEKRLFAFKFDQGLMPIVFRDEETLLILGASSSYGKLRH